MTTRISRKAFFLIYYHHHHPSTLLALKRFGSRAQLRNQNKGSAGDFAWPLRGLGRAGISSSERLPRRSEGTVTCGGDSRKQISIHHQGPGMPSQPGARLAPLPTTPRDSSQPKNPPGKPNERSEPAPNTSLSAGPQEINPRGWGTEARNPQRFTLRELRLHRAAGRLG